MVILIFNGSNDGVNFDTVKVLLNEGSQTLTAYKVNGGIASPFYQVFDPNIVEGSKIYTYTNSGIEYNYYFMPYYPFATTETEVVSPPPATDLTIDSVSVTPQTEVGLIDGTATVNASNGVEPYQYSLNSVDFQSSNIFTGLAPGEYTAFVKDASDDMAQYLFEILPAPPDPEPPVDEPIKDVICLSDAEIEIQNAYKRVQVLSKFGKVASVVSNGDFEAYDGQNWDFWVKYGGINVSRIQRKVVTSSGIDIPIENYAIRFNEVANVGKYIQHLEIPVQFGDTLAMSYRVGKTEGTGKTTGTVKIFMGPVPVNLITSYISKIRVKVGNYYLYNPDYGNSYQWTNQLATVSHKIDNPKGDLSNYIVKFNIPESPVTGSLVFEFFGFQKIRETLSVFPDFVGLVNKTEELPEYSPIDVDDIKASKSSQNGDNDIDGILNFSDNLGVYSQRPDPIEILFGDYFYRTAAATPLDNLYAIKYNGGYTTSWYEYTGGSSVKVPFGLALAKAIMTAYQKSFRMWSGGLNLKPNADAFSYLDVFSFDIPNYPSFKRKQFCVLGGEINLKTNQFTSVKLAEVFDRPAKTNDISVPSYPDMTLPDITQDPTGTTNNGIFTNEFTQEFV